MKRIEMNIPCCLSCPYCRRFPNRKYKWWCMDYDEYGNPKLLAKTEADWIGFEIPDWCTLPDVKECDHPFASVQTRCMGEINHCLKCGKDL